MKSFFKIFIMLICATSILFLSSCEKKQEMSYIEQIEPIEESEFKIYDINVESNYNLNFNSEGYCEFEIPIYSSVCLEREKLTISSIEGENIDGLETTISNIIYGDISLNSENPSEVNFVENTITVKLIKESSVVYNENIIVNKLNYVYDEIEHSLDVNVDVYDLTFASIYPTPFDLDCKINIEYSTQSKEYLIFIGNPNNDIVLKNYSMLGAKFVNIDKTVWHGRGGITPITQIGLLTEDITFTKKDFSNFEAYFTFSFTKSVTPWNCDNLIIEINTLNDNNVDTNYKMAFMVKSFPNLDDYYNSINELISGLNNIG